MIIVLPGMQYVLAAILIWIALSDLLYRKISNQINLILLLLWVLQTGVAISQLGPWKSHPIKWSADLGYPILGSLIIFLIGYGLFLIKRVGAGDVKLMAILGLWAGSHQLQFVMFTSLIGGVLALILPLLNLIELSLAHSLMKVSVLTRHLHIKPPIVLSAEKPSGIPYGIAIAAGAATSFICPLITFQP